MTGRGLALVAAGLLAAGAVWWWARDDDGAGAHPRRPPPGIPRPSETERVRYFWEVLRDGRTLALADAEIPVWKEIGEAQLAALGDAALDFLLSPERYDAFRRTPNHLVTVLRALPSFPGAREHPQLYAFFGHWLDPASLPAATPRANWPAEVRLRVFGAMKELPRAEAVPIALAEFEREERVHDLRGAAVNLLLATGHGAEVRALYDRLPAEPDFKTQLVVLLGDLAAPGAPPRLRRQAEVLRPLLEAEAESPVLARRVQARAALLRLGDPAMERALLETYARYRDEDPKTAWTALDLLVRDRPHPRVKEIALAAVRAGEGGLPFQAGARFLALWWRDDPAVRALLWSLVEERRVNPLMLVPHLARSDRERTVRWVEGELATGDWARIQEALRLVTGAPLPEVGPRMLGLVRDAAPARRPALYAALASLRTPGVEALLLAELDGTAPATVRDAAITELLNLGAPRGLARLATLLEEGDPVVLRALLRRARALGAEGVPAALLPGVLRALRRQPSEEGRRIALAVVRFRGTLEGIATAIVDAYRREPSRRVAEEIRLVIRELAHRT